MVGGQLLGWVLELTDERDDRQILLQQLWLAPLSWQVSIKNYCPTGRMPLLTHTHIPPSLQHPPSKPPYHHPLVQLSVCERNNTLPLSVLSQALQPRFSSPFETAASTLINSSPYSDHGGVSVAGQLGVGGVHFCPLIAVPTVICCLYLAVLSDSQTLTERCDDLKTSI